MTDPRLIAMIPARMGSKRVPRKNARLMCGKPLLRYAIDAALEAGCLDAIWVNTESDLLGRLAVQCEVGFHKRPEALAVDTATNQDFTTEFLQNHECDFVVMINPTSPLLQPATVRRLCELVRTDAHDTVLSVLDEKAECFFENRPVNFSTRVKTNSQDLTPVRKVVWALTAWRRSHFLDVAGRGECGVFSGRLGLFPMPLNESCDIDTQEQWDVVEGMLLAKSRSGNQPENIAYWE